LPEELRPVMTQRMFMGEFSKFRGSGGIVRFPN
jgi:hypothetical protein